MSTWRELRRWADAQTTLASFHRALRDLLGADVEILVHAIERATQVRPSADALAVLLATSRADGEAAGHAWVEAESTLASAVLGRVLRRPLRVPLAAADARSPSLAGALAAVLVACARRDHRGPPLRVLSAGSSADVPVRPIPGPGRAADAPSRPHQGDSPAHPSEALGVALLTVLLDRDAFSARVVVPIADGRPAPRSAWDRATLAALGPLPLSLPIVACAVRLPVADLASLMPGDALVASPWRLHTAGAALLGPVHLAAPSSAVGLRAELVEERRLVLRGEVEPLVESNDTEDSMGEGDEVDALVENVGAIPVVLRVEIGEATMAAREWAALGRGDIITLRRRVGDPVVLRVGDIPVATGELVSVDGEVGVRIVARTSMESAASPAQGTGRNETIGV
jgi:type III secretion system YscQ/HrcQ family protein